MCAEARGIGVLHRVCASGHSHAHELEILNIPKLTSVVPSGTTSH